MSKSKHVKNDPFAQREAEKYDNPIPSREFLLDLLGDADGPVTHPELCEQLKLNDDESIEALRRRLIAMARDGQLISNRRGAFARLDKIDVIRGRVQGHRDGYGFVIRADGGADIYLHNRQMRRVFDGDEVLVRQTGENHRGKDEGAIVEVLSHNTKQLAGRFVTEEGIQFVRPENARITHDIMIPPGSEGEAKAGQIVVAEIAQQPDKNRIPTGRIVQVLGDHMAPGMEIDLAIEAHSIPHTWPSAVTAEASQLSEEVREADMEGRVDLRDMPFLTIDGEDARDFDDALLCERRKGGGWRLSVAIAEVSHYVPVGSALDEEAKRRGTSVYFPDFVVPMLPEALSNGLCSLNPNVDRLCLVCEMTLSPAGKVTSYKFFEAVIHSQARLTYTKVWEILQNDGDNSHPLRQEFKHVVPQLHQLHGLYKVLRKAREERGAIDFETTETRIEFNEERKIQRIVPVHRNDAHKIVEECMLSANVCAARFLEKHRIESLYRVHRGPAEEKLANLREFLGELGLGLGGGDAPTSADFQALMQAIQGRSDSHLIQTVMLRSLRQAVYQVENEGHFGLGYDAYAHFTSPIRRYPDLLVHRALRSVIRGDQASSHVVKVDGAKPLPKQKLYPYGTADMLALGEHCSLTERRADEATRDVTSWLKCEYLQDHVGSVFEGVVSGVTGFGLFVELKDLYVDGLVHITALPKDYYRFEPAKHRLVGERTRKVFGLGDELKVRVVSVDLDSRKIDFEMEEVTSTRRGKGKTNARSPKAEGERKASSPAAQDKKRSRGKTDDRRSDKPGRSGRRGTGSARSTDASKTGRGSRTHGNQSKKKAQQPAQTAAVRPTKEAAPAKSESFLAAAASGFKKALAKFKKKG
ncbi:ribonuclease R [Marinimicrobium sp. ABcell2]|uniref:ribonuclease R n=1 Tax=Marinimicrobium sp. ABcell2 TaxID=3069751 RepID=UPI0027B6D2C1|nr:ribonuclease R [Marinimicrobium sp. ABcell2]MDQ2075811.1 ribonuclease R [Marinimicrobium sp. ABcell2]